MAAAAAAPAPAFFLPQHVSSSPTTDAEEPPWSGSRAPPSAGATHSSSPQPSTADWIAAQLAALGRREAPRASTRPPPRPRPRPTRRPRSPSARARAPHPGRRSWRPRRRRSRSNVIGERLGSVFVQGTVDATGTHNQRFFLALSLDTTADASRSSGASAATTARQGGRGQ